MATTDYARCRTAIRLLQTAVMLRQRPSTIDEVAEAMNVTTRTVRRDLIALEAIPFPLLRHDDGRWAVIGPSPLTDGRR